MAPSRECLIYESYDMSPEVVETYRNIVLLRIGPMVYYFTPSLYQKTEN